MGKTKVSGQIAQAAAEAQKNLQRHLVRTQVVRQQKRSETKVSASPSYSDFILTGLENKPGLVPILGGRKRRYQEHYRVVMRRWESDLKMQGKGKGHKRAIPPHGKKQQQRVLAEQARRRA